MKLPTVSIDGGFLSDLFFNSDTLKNWNAHNHSSGSFTVEARAALLEDAKAFVVALGISEQVTPEQLVEDFYNRL